MGEMNSYSIESFNSAKSTIKCRLLCGRCLDMLENHVCWRKIQELTSEFLTSICWLIQDTFCLGLIFAICINEIKFIGHVAPRISGSVPAKQQSVSMESYPESVGDLEI